jgi:hypothetical protein
MRGFYLLLIIFITFGSSGFGEEVTVEMAKKVARVHILDEIHGRPLMSEAVGLDRYSIKEIVPFKEEKELLAYIVHLKPKGFIAIAPDTEITPIVGYSYRSTFYMKDVPCNHLLHLLREDMKNRLKALPLMDEKRKNKNRELWERYIEGRIPIYEALYEQWPDWDTGWLRTTWRQGDPFNRSCPIDPETGKRCIVGCVATAIAQIVNYWEHPLSISFDEEDRYITETRGIRIDDDSESLDFPSFEELNRRLRDIDYPLNEEESADLSFACGIIVQMDYTSERSGAWFHPSDFIDDLQYISAVKKDPREDPDFYELLKYDMKNGRPALLSIWKEEGGHAIVADGYRTPGDYYHLNFGWGSFAPDPINEAWYNLPDGLPAGYTIVRRSLVNIEAPRREEVVISVEEIYGYPNPFILSEYGNMNILVEMNQPVKSSITIEMEIYDIRGELVHKVDPQDVKIDGSRLIYRWDGRNDDGRKVGSGPYICWVRVEWDGKIEERFVKIAVIR